MGGGGKKGSSVQFSRPQEPSFLRDLKKQVGYKDPVEDMNAKKITAEGLNNNQEERDDEKPTVVVLNEGDLTAEEAEKLNTTLQTEQDESHPVDGRIIFKKPVKRKSEQSADNSSDSKSKPKLKKKKEISSKPSLLSFNDEEEYM